MNRSARILGIDPGSQATGFGVVDVFGALSKPVRWGVIRTSGGHDERLRGIFEALRAVVRELEPDEIAVEKVFVHRNADSALKLGQARAAAICATFDAELPLFDYTPRHIKKAVVGSGSADKEQVQQMVRTILGIPGELEADAADALAAAVCHAHQRTARRLIGVAAGQS
jgi:crossover junction endodeoxyribonuclease RuvC